MLYMLLCTRGGMLGVVYATYVPGGMLGVVYTAICTREACWVWYIAYYGTREACWVVYSLLCYPGGMLGVCSLLWYQGGI